MDLKPVAHLARVNDMPACLPACVRRASSGIAHAAIGWNAIPGRIRPSRVARAGLTGLIP